MKFLVATLLVLGASAVPSFPSQWTATQITGVSTWQGGTHEPDGSACCAVGSPGCKVQSEGASGTFTADGKNQRTRSDSNRGTVVSWYGSVMKQFGVEPSGSGWKAVNCCPILPPDNVYTDPLKFDASAKDLGPATVAGQRAERWQWYDSIFKVVHMDTQDWFVGKNAQGEPVPLVNTETITPFGGAAIGQFFGNYSDFSTTIDASKFDISGLDTCQPPSQGCNPQPDDSSALRAVRARLRRVAAPRPSLARLAELAAGDAARRTFTEHPCGTP